MKPPLVSVLMPTYNQGAFISRAIASLKSQTFTDWELIVFNDGSTDYTKEVIASMPDERIRYYESPSNIGLGAALNKATALATAGLLAYLPSDDIYYPDHLQTLIQLFASTPGLVTAYSGMRMRYRNSIRRDTRSHSTQDWKDDPLQLVQVMHKKVEVAWLERSHLVTDDQHRMFWNKLLAMGPAAFTGTPTCEWVTHPTQRHRLINEGLGGSIHAYKQHFQVTTPIRFHSSCGTLIDEHELFDNFRPSQRRSAPEGLKILLVGELGYNPERIVALEEMGHELYGLWITPLLLYNAVGPFAFGNVREIPYHNWRRQVEDIKPDLIYALLNHQAVPLAHEVLSSGLDIPFVWHFKESPFYCRQVGLWKELVELQINSDGQIFTNPETKAWFDQFLEGAEGCAHILDGDLPSAKYFHSERSPLLSDADGENHIVVPGGPYGILPEHLQQLRAQHIHLHFYGEIHQRFWQDWLANVKESAGDYLHLHASCQPKDWVREFSRYDAGLLHVFRSENDGHLIKATWPDLNFPSRMNTMAAAGLPMISPANKGHLVAVNNHLAKFNAGILADDFTQLGDRLRDREQLQKIRESVWRNRNEFSFDRHCPGLVDFFREIIAQKKKNKDSSPGENRWSPVRKIPALILSSRMREMLS